MSKIHKQTLFIPALWFVLSVLTVFIYYNGNSNYNWIDIPTHFIGGMLVALIINGKREIEDVRKLFILSFLVFMGWESFEIANAALIPNQFVINIFTETVLNRTQDIVMDFFGFIFFITLKYQKSFIKE